MPVIQRFQPSSGVASDRWVFECPGCGCLHFFNDRWTFDGNTEKPTVSPSILVTYDGADKKTRCHLFIRNGMIEFLSDCTHELAGKTVPMIEMKEKQ